MARGLSAKLASRAYICVTRGPGRQGFQALPRLPRDASPHSSLCVLLGRSLPNVLPGLCPSRPPVLSSVLRRPMAPTASPTSHCLWLVDLGLVSGPAACPPWLCARSILLSVRQGHPAGSPFPNTALFGESLPSPPSPLTSAPAQAAAAPPAPHTHSSVFSGGHDAKLTRQPGFLMKGLEPQQPPLHQEESVAVTGGEASREVGRRLLSGTAGTQRHLLYLMAPPGSQAAENSVPGHVCWVASLPGAQTPVEPGPPLPRWVLSAQVSAGGRTALLSLQPRPCSPRPTALPSAAHLGPHLARVDLLG